jgi:methylated-DNA-[protein]-cysteine S-methyltransferase
MNDSTIYHDTYEGPQGSMLLVADGQGLCGVYFEGQKYFPVIDPAWKRNAQHAPLRQARRELAEYFGGERKRFDITLAPRGTPFQQSVWKAIATVGFGKTMTYSDLAECAGHPRSARAAGTATGRNPLSIIVPCHRIVGSNGSLTGYAGGLERKRALLALESGDRDRRSQGGQMRTTTSLPRHRRHAI